MLRKYSDCRGLHGYGRSLFGLQKHTKELAPFVTLYSLLAWNLPEWHGEEEETECELFGRVLSVCANRNSPAGAA